MGSIMSPAGLKPERLLEHPKGTRCDEVRTSMRQVGAIRLLCSEKSGSGGEADLMWTVGFWAAHDPSLPFDSQFCRDAQEAFLTQPCGNVQP